MKGNKMSAILAILLMLSGALFVQAFIPRAYSVPPLAGAVQAGLDATIPTHAPYHINASFTYPAVTPGSYSFTAYVDVINVTNLFSYAVGFTFDPTYLQVTSVSDGGFIGAISGSNPLFFPGTIDNVGGKVTAYGAAITDASKANSGSGHLLTVVFSVPAFAPPYTGTYPGSPASMMHFTMDQLQDYALLLTYNDGVSNINPLPQNLHDGFFTLSVVPTPPTATFTAVPYPINYYNLTSGLETFNSAGSTGGNLGYGSDLAIFNYIWDFGDLSTLTTTSPIVTHNYAAPPPLPSYDTYTVTLIVNNTSNQQSAPFSLNVIVKYTAAGVVSVFANPQHLYLTYPTYAPGYSFTAYIDIANVTNLFSFQVGFTFDAHALQVISVVDGGFLGSNGGTVFFIPGTLDNVGGVYSYAGEFLNDTTKAPSVDHAATGHLLRVNFVINPALFPPYTGVYPGSPVTMIHLSNTTANIQLILFNNESTNITPFMDSIFDGYFKLSVSGAYPPTAIFGISPLPPVYVGSTQIFTATGSLPGFNGFASTPVVWYFWDFGDGTKLKTAAAIVTHTFMSTGTKQVKLIVQDTAGQNSTVTIHADQIVAHAAGCFLDLTSQNWRYIDPMTIQGALNGLGLNVPADVFRPGDLVQLFANCTYNGDEVAAQLVNFQVIGPAGNTIAIGTAISNAAGIAEFDFRIPWPTGGGSLEFGAWTAIATWQIGSNTPVPPGEVTQQDIMGFKVSWGLTITDYSTTYVAIDFVNPPPGNAYDKLVNNAVTVKINVQSDYFEPVNALATVTLYDDLNVPFGTAYVMTTFLPGQNQITFPFISIPEWAFVGTGKAKADVFSTWPWSFGTAFCPEVTKTFTILLS